MNKRKRISLLGGCTPCFSAAPLTLRHLPSGTAPHGYTAFASKTKAFAYYYYQTKRAKQKFTFVSLPTGRQASEVPVKSGPIPRG